MQDSHHAFKIHSFDTDAFGMLSAPGLLGYLLESSGRSADQLGFGIAKLQAEHNLTWVIARIKIVLDEPLRFLEELEVQTWPSGLMRSAALRDFRIKKSGREVGRATSLWFVLDMQSRLPVHPHDVFPEALRPETEHLVSLSRSIVPLKDPPDIERRFSVRYADIDLNRHVTAASYLAWAMEAVDDGTWSTQRLSSVDIQFLEECHLGKEILSSSRSVEPGCRLHRITRSSDHKELTRMLSTWVPRDA